MNQPTEASSRRPTHTAFTVRESRDGGKAHWIEVGAAWTNRDGSLSLQLDAMPVNGRLVLQERRDDAGAGQG